MKNIIVLPTDKNLRYLAEQGYKVIHRPPQVVSMEIERQKRIAKRNELTPPEAA